MSVLQNGSGVGAPVFGGDHELVQHANTQSADSVSLLSSTKDSSNLVRQVVELSSVVITIDGQARAKVNLDDVRKHLMIMGLFPPDLYGVGESFEETRLRYILGRSCSNVGSL